MALARLYTFTAGTTIVAAQMNAELNQLVQALNGSLAVDIKMTNSNVGTPTLEVDHTGAGNPFRARVGGLSVVRVTPAGQIEVTPINSANPPFIIGVNAGKVDNLDADKLDGKHLDDVVWLAKVGAQVLNPSDPNGRPALGFRHGTNQYYTQLYQIGSNTFGIERVNSAAIQTNGDNEDILTLAYGSPNVATFEGQIAATATAPTAITHLTRKDYVDARVSPWAFGAYYDGQISTAMVQPVYIVPNLGAIKPKKLRASFRAGTTTGVTTIKIGRYNSAGVLYGAPSEWSITIPQAQAVNTVVTFTIPDDVTFAENDQLVWTVTAAGGHQDVTVFVTGTEGLS